MEQKIVVKEEEVSKEEKELIYPGELIQSEAGWGIIEDIIQTESETEKGVIS